MKIRFGFVSNSSTSSFVGIGWKVDSMVFPYSLFISMICHIFININSEDKNKIKCLCDNNKYINKNIINDIEKTINENGDLSSVDNIYDFCDIVTEYLNLPLLYGDEDEQILGFAISYDYDFKVLSIDDVKNKIDELYNNKFVKEISDKYMNGVKPSFISGVVRE